VDAAFTVIKKLTHKTPRLVNFTINSITGGTDAQAEVSVRIEEDGTMANGQAADTDIVVASAKAFVHALNKLEYRKKKAFTAQL
jgi:2-isopropylmalate synthase